MDFPNELLEIVVIHALPESFESLALSCKRIYALCTPFIEHHNTLRWHFQNFHYCKTNKPFKLNQELFTFPDTASSAFNLIARIAVEPVVARYIQEADFENDSRLGQGLDRRWTTHPYYCDQAVSKLFANSPYLEEVGSGWKGYYAAMEEDLNAGRYSQHAAAFVLTLLPNLRVLRLPRWWKPAAAPDKLIDAVIHRARLPYSVYPRPSMAQVTEVQEDVSRGFDLDWVFPFLALPRIQSLWCPNCVSTGSGHRSIMSKYLHCAFTSGIEEIHLGSVFIDEVTIADLLKHTPCLKTLTYWHSTKGTGSQNWDLCQFVTAIQYQVGSHLAKLSINISKSHGSIPLGKPSMQGFQRLQWLELPLEIAVCGLAAAALDGSEWLLSDLVPASVSHFSLVSHGTDHHANTLHTMFRDFATRDSQLLNLKEIHLSCRPDASELYKEQCAELAVETKKAGVVLKQRPYTGPTFWTDDEEIYYESESE